MLVWASRTVSALTLRALFYLGLFLAVVVTHVAITTAFRALGWSAGLAMGVSGGIVLTLVLGGLQVSGIVMARRNAAREAARTQLKLPAGPCCVVWRGGEVGGGDMPWEATKRIRAKYPKIAQSLGIEGYALVHFEINSEGLAKSVHCIDAWPTDLFYEAARDGLMKARFQLKDGENARFGTSYTMPFVFRIARAARAAQEVRAALSHKLDMKPAKGAAHYALARVRGIAQAAVARFRRAA